jgi:hypothetical protein
MIMIDLVVIRPAGALGSEYELRLPAAPSGWSADEPAIAAFAEASAASREPR